ncbi:hypothetical protein F4820DRAFT_449777 [Hypoxylon rubiginosum]|uniref:Uncharacterized protein n=1 Tax=Hypoxylon rubiginosum TaxID=110542 RepID=A0ACB9YW87_9PEZI|nr:hypothetical protein F4820DRAFT_449777 [Hypoxylon rubiginosum]
MSSRGTTFGPVETVRRRQYCQDSEGNRWTRRMKSDGTYTEWEIYNIESAPEPATCSASPAIHLYVIQQDQAVGEPLHWSLFVGSEGSRGMVYQVKGDATYMHYQHAYNINIWTSQSYRNGYRICELDQNSQAWVDYYANSVPPPQAASQHEVTENCQG